MWGVLSLLLFPRSFYRIYTVTGALSVVNLTPEIGWLTTPVVPCLGRATPLVYSDYDIC